MVPSVQASVVAIQRTTSRFSSRFSSTGPPSLALVSTTGAPWTSFSLALVSMTGGGASPMLAPVLATGTCRSTLSSVGSCASAARRDASPVSGLEAMFAFRVLQKYLAITVLLKTVQPRWKATRARRRRRAWKKGNVPRDLFPCVHLACLARNRGTSASLSFRFPPFVSRERASAHAIRGFGRAFFSKMEWVFFFQLVGGNRVLCAINAVLRDPASKQGEVFHWATRDDDGR